MSEMTDINQLGTTGMQALRAGDGKTAREKFEAIAAAGQADISVWIAIALSARIQADWQGVVGAADRALNLEPRNLRALILKGDALWNSGDKRGAASFYDLVGRLAPEGDGLPAEMAVELLRVRRLYESHKSELVDHIEARLSGLFGHRDGLSARFRQSLDLLAERRQRYIQQPRAFYYPELPDIQFYEPSEFEWTDDLMASSGAIQREFESARADISDFVPYIHTTGNKPVNKDNPLIDSQDWTALFIQKDGVVLDRCAERFANTLAALSGVPQEIIPGRGPSSLISRLAPKARIAAHVGFLNTRLTCHLPLEIPGDCGLRVGNETREWRRDELLIFNDSIEHEAWNNSDRERFVLIFQVWRPEISLEERIWISSVLQEIDTYFSG
jgi:hypothetical protein